MIANNTTLQNINNTLNDELSKRDNEITKLRQEIASLKCLRRKRGHPGTTSSDSDPTSSDSSPPNTKKQRTSGSKGRSKKGGTKSGGSAGGSGPPPPVIPPTNPHPNIVPPTNPDEWKQRVKDVTKCQTLREHCKIMCSACKWTYRDREIILQSHLGHLKTKHGGFTPSKVDGQNPYM